MNYVYILNQIYTTLATLTESEPDPELQKHYDYLLDGLQKTIIYFNNKETEE